MKELADEFAPIITLLYNRCLKQGELPNDWKTALVSPIYKKGDVSEPANYRPVSLTCILCKCMEHIITSHIATHLDNNKILTFRQHGFRQGLSCDTQFNLGDYYVSNVTIRDIRFRNIRTGAALKQS